YPVIYLQADGGKLDFHVDWSSDVCSSDLLGRRRAQDALVSLHHHGLLAHGGRAGAAARRALGPACLGGGGARAGDLRLVRGARRSEERRVGKQATERSWPDDETKKGRTEQ